MAKPGARDSVVVVRYASALLDLAEEKNALEDVSRDLDALVALAGECEDFSRFVSSPLIPKGQQTRFMELVAEKGGFSPLIKNFINVLISNGRLKSLVAVAQEFSVLKAARSGEVAIRIETARELSDQQKKGVQEKMSVALGRTVRVEAAVDATGALSHGW